MAEVKLNYSEYNDPKLVTYYDALNAFGRDSRFFCDLAKHFSASTIIDLGCGTGTLACELAKLGFRVIGIEPASAMLDIAKQKPYSEKISWIQGSSAQMEGLEADLILMTSHVAQLFLKDEEWNSILKATYKALKPGGHIAFDSRNPLTKPWERWTHKLSNKTVTGPDGMVEIWNHLLEIKENQVSYEIHYMFKKSGEELISINKLVYRSKDETVKSLSNAGFIVKNIYGDWDNSPVSPESPEMIFVGEKI
jgi:ubiquinone/menaquinone biosynthesis C-methylase UbiE